MTGPDSPLTAAAAQRDVFAKFYAAADPVKAAGAKAYMRDQFEFLGIQTPVRRRLSRDVLTTARRSELDWDFVYECWDKPEREFQYLAVDYLQKMAGALTPGDIAHIRYLITTKSWWDTVDALDTLMGGLSETYPEVRSVLLEWSTDDNIWLRRAAIDHQLLRKDRTDTALLEQILVNNLGSREFFINKAIGWSLREYSKTNPDWVRAFLDRHREDMAPLSIREASKYV